MIGSESRRDQFERWWTKEGLGDGEETPHSSALQALKRIFDRQGYRRTADRMYLRLFEDVRYVGFDAGSPSEVSVIDDESFLRARLNENVIRAVAQTIHNKLMRQRIRPDVITEGGNWELQQQAEMLDKYLQGLFDQLKADRLFAQQRLHGIITGTGFLKVCTRDGEPYAEVVPSWEVWVDASEGRYGDPVSFYQFKAMDRERLKELFVEDGEDGERVEELIDKAGRDSYFALGTWDRDGSSDMVATFEAWHLPSGKDADDGRHIVMTDNCTLENVEWKRERPPFAAFRYAMRAGGFFGAGAVEDLVGQQLELSRTLAARQEALSLLSAPYVLLERGSKIVRSHFSNLIGRIIEYTNVKPEVIAPTAVNPEIFAHGDRVKASMFEQARVSQLSATMQKPAGLNSGKALRTYADLESEGLVDALQNAQESVLDFAWLLLEESEEAASAGKAPKVTYLGEDGLETIEWGKISLKKNQYKLKIAPASALSTTVAGKLQDLQDLRDLGIVTDPAEMRQLIGLPDLEKSESRDLAHRKLLLKVLEKVLLKEGKYVHPEPYWDHQLALKLVTDTLLDAQLREAPQDRIDLLLQFSKEVQDYLQPPAEPTPQAMPGTEAFPPPALGPDGLPALPAAGPLPAPPNGAPMQPPMGAPIA
jgi:hypothetical protein